MPQPASLNLLILNLAMDERHTALGHVPAWTNALARHAAHVDVITMLRGPAALEPNVHVHSLGKEAGRSEPRRLVTFYRSLHEILSERRIDACFAHMAPLFAALAAPELKVRRIPLLLWYAHPATPRTLRLAHAAADRVVTSTPTAFGLRSEKVVSVGQGIDTERFRPPDPSPPGRTGTALSIGRLSPIKGAHDVIDAIGRLRSDHGRDVRLEVVGGAHTESDRSYAEGLERQTAELGVDDLVTFHGEVAHTEIPEWYRRGELFLNLSGGALDKATLESMASGCIPVSSNPAFAEAVAPHGLERLVAEPGPSGLARAIDRVLSAPPAERTLLSAEVRALVERDHGLERLALRLMTELEDLAPSTRAPVAA